MAVAARWRSRREAGGGQTVSFPARPRRRAFVRRLIRDPQPHGNGGHRAGFVSAWRVVPPSLTSVLNLSEAGQTRAQLLSSPGRADGTSRSIRSWDRSRRRRHRMDVELTTRCSDAALAEKLDLKCAIEPLKFCSSRISTGRTSVASSSTFVRWHTPCPPRPPCHRRHARGERHRGRRG